MLVEGYCRFYLIICPGSRFRIVEDRLEGCEREHGEELSVGLDHLNKNIHINRVR